MIQVRELTKSYGLIKAIDSLNFEIKKGEVVGFLGPNGAGKSTTMKIITGFMAPTSGSASVAGFDVFESPLEVKRRIGYLPETPPVYGDMLVKDYLSFVAELKGVERSRLQSSVARAIDKTNLGAVANRLIQNLSKGFRQRVGIAQAIVSDPEVLILDEPTVGLDPKQVAEIRDLIKELRGQHTIVLSTHILPEVQATCERIVIIHQGKIVAQDSLENLSHLQQGLRKVHLEVKNVKPELLQKLRELPGVIRAQSVPGSNEIQLETSENQDLIERVASLVIQSGAGLQGISSVKADLEDIFLKLTYGSAETAVSAAEVL